MPATTTVADERLLLAAELQDLIAHRLTALVVHAAAAERILPRTSAAAVDTLAAIRQLALGLLDDLTRLGRLLDDGASASALRPAPTLTELDGDPRVELRAGDVAAPEGVALCAVRAVDVLLAAGTAAEVVTVTVTHGAVRIETPEVPSPETAARLRVRARPCGGRLVRTAGGGMRLELPFAP